MNSGIKNILSPRGINQSQLSRRPSNILSPYKSSSRLNVSGRLNQSSSQILSKTSGYVVEQFGCQLPVLITEALKFSDGNTTASVNISDGGWAWFVCGRRLLVWQAAAGAGRPLTGQCRELPLPPSDLAHRAHLVAVYSQHASQMPCCLAVSPEGIVRYWPSIAHESSWTEVNADLQGQECDSLHLVLPLGALLVTTTASLVLVTPHLAAARHALLCRPVRPPHGWLGGIGRRVSSLIFGSLPAGQIMETKLVKAVCRAGASGDWSVSVLAGHSLQRWQLANGEMEQLLFEADLARPLRDAYDQAETDIQELILLDMQQASNSILMLLVAGVQHDSQLSYALVSVKSETAPLAVSWFRPLSADELGPLAHQSHGEPPMQFLLSGQVALLYTSTHVVAVPVQSSKEVEHLDFGQGHIVGGALFGQKTVFFSTFNGFISVASTESMENDISMTVNEMLQESGISESNIEELTQQKDNVGLLKAAFLLYIRKQLAQSKAALENLFSGESTSIDAMLGTAVLQTSLELINDVPSKDPRWADQKSNRLSIGASNSLQIVHQLEEKQRVLQWYVSFLKDMQLWDKLGSVTHNGRLISATYVLQEHAEKVAAAIALKKAHSKFSDLADKIIEDVLMTHNKRPYGSLTNQDLFYQQVSLVDEAIQHLVKWTEGLVFSEPSPQVVASQILSANSLLMEMVRGVSELRVRLGRTYEPLVPGVWEKKLWTSASGPHSVGDSLAVQIKVTVQHGVKAAGEQALRADLLDQLTALVDCVLDGRKTHVESLRNSAQFTPLLHQYEADRLSYLQLLMEEKEYERAAMLGEKYLDFQILIDICQNTNNKEKLNYYIKKFSTQGFAKFLFGWYVRERRQSDLVRHCAERGGGEQLAPLLAEQPSLSWLHDLALSRPRHAADTLSALARDEKQLLQRKKSQLSLAKLALLASSEEDPTEDIEEIDSALKLITFQEHLPESLLTLYGYDPENIRTFSPPELVKLYTSDDNPISTEFSYKTALDILNYVDEDEERDLLRNEIWTKAVCKDSWSDLDPNTPQSSIQQLFFFRLFELCIIDGCEDMVPSLNELMDSDDLGHFKEDKSFQFLLQVVYEHFTKDSDMATL